MKTRGPLLLLFCALAALLMLPGASSAKPGYKVRPAGTELWIDLGERGDYELLVEADHRQRVLLAVEESLLTATEYSTKGRVSSKRIEADFGELGRIDIRIRLAPGRSYSFPPKKGCKGRATINVPGTFRGTIEYAGEGDIQPFSVKRGPIEFTRRFRRVCKQPRKPGRNGETTPKPKIEVGLLEAFSKVEGRTSFLGAINVTPKKNPGRSLGYLVAGVYERIEGVLIEKSTLTFFGHDSFRVSKPGRKPETVETEFENPFTGRGLYSRKPGSPPSWTGDLAVDLPGAKALPLAGPDFEARFCRGPSEAKAIERCAQGSGSHSQPLALARLSSLR